MRNTLPKKSSLNTTQIINIIKKNVKKKKKQQENSIDFKEYPKIIEISKKKKSRTSFQTYSLNLRQNHFVLRKVYRFLIFTLIKSHPKKLIFLELFSAII